MPPGIRLFRRAEWRGKKLEHRVQFFAEKA